MPARLFALAAILLCPAFVSAQSLADRVPADSMVYVGWKGSADMGPAYPASNLKAVMDDSNIPDFVDRFLPEIVDKISKMNPQAGEIGQILSAIGKPTWQHPTAFFFAGVEVVPGKGPTPHLGIIWQPGADGNELSKHLEQLIAQAPLPFPAKVVHQGEIVALLLGYEDAEAALGGFQTKSLAQDGAFKNAMSHLTVKDPVGAAYIDYERLLKFADDMIQQSNDPDATKIWPKVRDDLGIAGLKRIVIATGFDGKDSATQAFAESPEPRTGILKLVGFEPLDDAILSAIPQTVTSAGAGRFDSAGLFDLIRRTLQDANPQAAHEVDQFIETINSDSHVDLRKDLLASVGDEWAYFADPTLGGRGMASFTIVNHLKDPAKFEQSLDKIEDYALQQIQKEAASAGADAPVTIRFQTTKVDGMTVHYLAVPLVAPSWVVQGGNLYVSLFPQVAASAARHAEAKGPSILRNEKFLAVRTRLGQKSPAAFSFEDLQQTAPDAYGSWLVITRLLGFADLFGVTSPPLILPQLDKLQEHLGPAGVVKWADADGFHMRAVEPFAGSTIVASDPATSAIYAEPVLISILLPALNRAREQANRVKSASNLRQIAQGAMLYANDHKGMLPADLGIMTKEEDLTPQVFINPRSDKGAVPPPDKSQWPDWVKEHSDYVWLGEGKNMAKLDADMVLAHEKLEDNTEGINIAFGDGHVEWYTMPQAQQLIEKARGVPKAP